ncbi:MAG: alkyl sulfatase dimerization domain-containing protein [Oceanococcaceae bacterium]
MPTPHTNDMPSALRLAGALCAAFVLTACQPRVAVPLDDGADDAGHSPPTTATARANAAVAETLPLDDQRDFENARRGLIASADALVVTNTAGKAIWNQTDYAFQTGEAPASVNPSLWRQARLNAIHGLFKVSDRIYQLRGFDLANMTLIEGDSGWIIVDPLTTRETAAAAWEFAQQHLPPKPIAAIVFTHSHVDHFGGIAGLMSAQELAQGNVRIIAPAGFTEEATSENVMAGVAMQRRASYQYGARLTRSERGHVDLGLGKEVPFGGLIGIAAPTELIDRTPQELEIDGLRFVFQFTPGSEAPAEFTFYLPELKAFCGAEVVSRTLHNVYTLRGAKVRDALRWSSYIHEAIRLFGDAEVYFASHHWPMWGNADVVDFLKKQRDAYKYIHDQTVRMANLGLTPREIAEEISMPQSLQQEFSTRGYYGTVKHNAKAVYQFYFGWYDANPANLDPLPPQPAAKKYVAAMGGIEATLAQVRTAYEAGEYRWAAELGNHAVFAAPDNAEARALLARSYDQLGYQAESGPWRDVYLSAAYELRHGEPAEGINMTDAIGLLAAIPLHHFFESMAARLNGPKADGKNLTINFMFKDRGVGYHLWVENAVLHSEPLIIDGDTQPADATLTLTHDLFLQMATDQAGIKDLLLSDELDIDGSRLALITFFGLLDKPEGRFAIVTP